MIVVDTSVWVRVLRKAPCREAAVLESLVDADEVALAVPVRIEILSGASERDRRRLRRSLSALPVLYPTDDTWRVIDDWIDRAGRSGEHFGVGDYLIAAIAHEAEALVWSLDGDFRRMAALSFVGLYEP